MSFRASPWSDKPREGYFIMKPYVRQHRDGLLTPQSRILKACTTKDEAEKALAEYEKAGVAVWIEDLEGKRLS